MKLSKKLLSLAVVFAVLLSIVPSVTAYDFDIVAITPRNDKIMELPPFSLSEELTKEYADFFEKLLADPVDRPDVVKTKSPYTICLNGRDLNLFIPICNNQLDAFPIQGWYTPNIAFTYQTANFIAVREIESKKLISIQTISQFKDENGNFDQYPDFIDYKLSVVLPECFDLSTHEVIFFSFIVDYTDPESFYGVSEYPQDYYVTVPLCIDNLDSYIFGDANKDGKVRLNDVILMLKYIAKWDSIVIDRTLFTAEKDNPNYCWYYLELAKSTLKLCADWDPSNIDTAYPISRAASAHYIDKGAEN